MDIKPAVAPENKEWNPPAARQPATLTQRAPQPAAAPEAAQQWTPKRPHKDVLNNLARLENTDPDRYARVMNWHKATGYDAVYIDANLDAFEKLQKRPTQEQVSVLAAEAPYTYDLLQNNESAPLISDDYEKMGFMERKIKKVINGVKYTARQQRYADLLGKQREADWTGKKYGTDYENEIALAELELADIPRPEGGFWAQMPFATAELGSQLLFSLPQAAAGAAAGAGTGAVAGVAAGSAVPGAGNAAGAGGGALWGARLGFVGGMAKYAYELEGNLAYGDLRKLRDKNGNPLPVELAVNTSKMVGRVNAALETAGDLVLVKGVLKPLGALGGKAASRLAGKSLSATLGKVVGKIPGASGLAKILQNNPAAYENLTLRQAVKEAAKDWALSMASEVSTEYAQNVVQEGMQELAKRQSGQDFDLRGAAEVLDESLDGMVDVAAGTAGLGFLGGLGGLHRHMGRMREAAEVSRAYEDLGNGMKDLKLPKRDPDKAIEFLSKQTDGTPLENVYVPIEALKREAKANDVDPRELLQQIGPEAAAQYEEAEATGGDVEIKTSVWAVKAQLAGKKTGKPLYQALAKDIKSGPDKPSLAELERDQEVMAEEAKKADELIAAGEAEQTELDAAVKQWKAVLAQTPAPENIKPEEFEKQTDAAAQLMGRMTLVEAKKRKVDSADLPAQMPLPAVQTRLSEPQQLAAKNAQKIYAQIKDGLVKNEETLAAQENGGKTPVLDFLIKRGGVRTEGTAWSGETENWRSKQSAIRGLVNNKSGMSLEEAATAVQEYLTENGYGSLIGRDVTDQYTPAAPDLIEAVNREMNAYQPLDKRERYNKRFSNLLNVSSGQFKALYEKEFGQKLPSGKALKDLHYFLLRRAVQDGMTPSETVLAEHRIDADALGRDAFSVTETSAKNPHLQGINYPVNDDVPGRLDTPMTPVDLSPKTGGKFTAGKNVKKSISDRLGKLINEKKNIVLHNGETGWKATLSQKSIKKMKSTLHRQLGYGSDMADALLLNIDKLFNAATLVKTYPDSRSREIKQIHRFFVPAKYGKLYYAVKLTVKEFASGRAELSAEELEQNGERDFGVYDLSVPKKIATDGNSAGRSPRPASAATDSIAENAPDFKPTLREILRGVSDTSGTYNLAKDGRILFQKADTYDENGRARTDSPEFKKWFGTSKVVDKNGQPLVVYHGSPAVWEVFDKDKSSSYNLFGPAFYASDSEEIGLSYKGGVLGRTNPQASVMPVHLQMQRPYDLDIPITDNEIAKIKALVKNDKEHNFHFKRIDENVKSVYPAGIDLSEGSVNPQYVTRANLQKIKNWLVDNKADWKDAKKGALTRADVYAILTDDHSSISGKRALNAFLRRSYDGFVYKRTGNGLDNRLDYIKHRVYMVFEPEQIKSVYNRGTWDADNPNIYFQFAGETAAPARGSYDPVKRVITLAPEANASTLIHELAHYWLQERFEYVLAGKADEAYLADFAPLKKYLDIKDGQKDLTRAQHEKFAKSFEAYLREGVAPDVELKGVFTRFRRWMLRVYKDVQKQLGVELNDDIRRVFDRMLATEEAIATAERERTYEPFSKVPGMTDEDVLRLKKWQEEAHETAVAQLMKEQMAELAVENEQKRNYAEEKAYEQIHAQMSTLPQYQIANILESHFAAKEKMRSAKELAHAYHGNTLTQDERALFDALSELNGYKSGAEAAELIVRTPALEEAVNKAVEKQMEKYRLLKDMKNLRQAAAEVLNNERALEVLALERELFVNRKRTASVQKALERKEAAKKFAREFLRQKSARQASRFTPYYAAQKKAAKNAARALAKQDWEKAAEFKDQELLNGTLAAESIKIRKRYERTLDYLKFIRRKPVKLLKKQEHWLQVAELLRRLDIPRLDYDPSMSVETLSEWAAHMKERGFDGVAIPDWIMNEGRDLNHVRLNIDSLQAVAAAIKNIIHAANFENRLFSMHRKLTMDQLGQKVAAHLQKTITPQERARYKDQVEPEQDGAKKGLQDYLYSMTTLNTLMHKADGYHDFGLMYETFVRPTKEAADKESVHLRQFYDAYAKLIATHYTKVEWKALYEEKRYYPELGNEATKERLLVMALNMGNETNRKRLTDNPPVGYVFKKSADGKDNAWTEENVLALLRGNLTANDWDFVQGVWDLINEPWPALSEMHKQLTGFTPGKVEALPFAIATADGKLAKLRGGYFPIKYDVRGSRWAETEDYLSQPLYTESNQAWFASTKTGHLKARARDVQHPLALNLNLVERHMSDVLHDLYFRPVVVDLRRLLDNEYMRAALRGNLGRAGYNQLKSHLNMIATGGQEYSGIGVVNKTVEVLRRHTTIAVLAGKLSILAENFANPWLFAGAVEGFTAADVLKGVGLALADYGPGSLVGTEKTKAFRKMVFEKSPLMKDKSENFDYTLRTLKQTKIFGDNSKLLEFTNAAMVATDDFFAVPMWWTAYNKFRDAYLQEHPLPKNASLTRAQERIKNAEARGVERADLLITRVLGSGRRYDAAEIIRSRHTLVRCLTMFATFMGNEFNRWSRETGLALKERDAVRYAGFVAGRLLVWSTISMLLAGKWPDELEPDELLKWWIGGVVGNVSGMFIGLRDLVPVMVNRAMGWQSFGYRPTPISGAVEDILIRPVQSVRGLAKGTASVQDVAENMARAASLAAPYPGQLNSWFFNAFDYVINGMTPSVRDAYRRRPKKERS